MVASAFPETGEHFSIYLCRLDPVIGSEMSKTRPCLIVSPDQLNRYLNTVLIAPLTSTKRSYVSRVNCQFAGKTGQICLDQIRCLDRTRLIKRLGRLDQPTRALVTERLADIFA